jgi:hypothetical protein
MVKIEVKCKDGYSAKEWSKDDGTLAYFLKGPNSVANDKSEIGRYDVRGQYAGKFKSAFGARKRFGVLEGQRAADNAVVTITTPDGNSVFIGDIDAGKMTTQDRITLGMCINNATNILSSQGIGNLNGIESQVFDLADRLFAEYQSRYGEE